MSSPLLFDAPQQSGGNIMEKLKNAPVEYKVGAAVAVVFCIMLIAVLISVAVSGFEDDSDDSDDECDEYDEEGYEGDDDESEPTEGDDEEKASFGHLDRDTLNEAQLEGFLNTRAGSGSVFDFAEPHDGTKHVKVVEDLGYDPSIYSVTDDIRESHREYSADALVSAGSASFATGLQVNTHATDVNPYVGLRRPMYDAKPEQSARVTSSEYPEQVKRDQSYQLF